MNRSEAHRTHGLNHEAFAAINEQSAYWCGFLMADGCIHRRSEDSYQIILFLQERDKDHIAKYKTFLQSEHKIITRKPNGKGWRAAASTSYGLSFNSTRIATDLASFGVTQSKSHTASVKRLANNRHFWRGVVDGDGSVYRRGGKYNYPGLFLCGSLPLMNQFLAYLTKHIPDIKCSVTRSPTVYTLHVGGKAAREACGLLYGRASVALERKESVARGIIEGR